MAKNILSNKQALIGIIIVIFITLIAILAPYIAPNDPNKINPSYKFAKQSKLYPLGGDQLGRCVLSRLIYGARYSLGLAVPALLILAVISTIVGTLSAYIGGKIDKFFAIICDIFMAFPPLIIVLSLMGSLGQGVMNILVAVVFSMWVWFARVIRSYVLVEKRKGYITASKIAGCSDYKIITRHIIPNILPQLIVYFSTGIALMILMISGFSFLGLGLKAGTAEWGAMLSNGKAYLYTHPSLLIYPGTCILVTATGFNLFGEAVRDVISPQNN
ncbi:ABC transporter permease subunit [Clostridiaceae bacterium M8S5]|nr:ABC transporter permease subunit [Clostridiaceae bacterium M8S5]